jgi:hypothetical protein
LEESEASLGLKKVYFNTQGNKTAPAKIKRVPATCKGLKTKSPRFMRMNELPQIQPNSIIKTAGNHEYFTLQKSVKFVIQRSTEYYLRNL